MENVSAITKSKNRNNTTEIDIWEGSNFLISNYILSPCLLFSSGWLTLKICVPEFRVQTFSFWFKRTYIWLFKKWWTKNMDISSLLSADGMWKKPTWISPHDFTHIFECPSKVSTFFRLLYKNLMLHYTFPNTLNIT